MIKISPKGVYKHRSYTIEELSALLGKTEKTLFRWIELGLNIIPESKRPILIMGSDLKEFLGNKYSKKKVKLNRSQFYCFTCKEAVYAQKGSIKKLGNRKIAVCRACRGKVSKIFKPYREGL